MGLAATLWVGKLHRLSIAIRCLMPMFCQMLGLDPEGDSHHTSCLRSYLVDVYNSKYEAFT
jgi:hypothetical protein